MASSSKSSLKCADITNEWGLLIEYRVKIKVKFLGAFLYQNEKPKASIQNDEKLRELNNSGLTLNGTMCDHTVICDDQKFSCHKAILATNSNVFKVCKES